MEHPPGSLERVKVILKIIDPETMNLHQQWIWYVLNKHPNRSMDKLMFAYSGDISKEGDDFNFKSKDSNGINLDWDFALNESRQKHILISLKDPIPPGVSGGPYFMEFDWESPSRSEVWRISSGQRELSYELHTPKDFTCNPRVIEISYNMQYNRSKVPIKKQHTNGNNVYLWKLNDLKGDAAYRIEW